jgi:predicted RNA-binding Zn-ribbon protein involved in translation (DUF1610 family)
MPIKAECESCGKVLNAKDDAAGKRIKCPDCGEPISVPGGRRKKAARKKTARRRPEPEGEPDLSNLDFGRLASMERRSESLGRGTVEECIECGEPVGKFSEECPHCGEPIQETKKKKRRAARRQAAAHQEGRGKPLIVEDKRDFEKEPSKAPMIVAVVIGVIALGVGGYFGYEYYQDSNPAPASAPAEDTADPAATPGGEAGTAGPGTGQTNMTPAADPGVGTAEADPDALPTIPGEKPPNEKLKAMIAKPTAKEEEVIAAIRKFGLVIQTTPGGRASGITTDKNTVTIGAGDLNLFSQLPILEEIKLRGFPLGDAVLREAKTFRSVKSLNLDDANVTDSAFREFAKSTVAAVTLRRTAITDDGIRSLSQHSSLEELTVDETRITGVGFESFTAAAKLRRLSVGKTQFMSQHVKHLVKLKNLEYLNIGDCANVTDEAVPELSKLTDLKTLRIYMSGISDGGRQQLQNALPDVDLL